MLRLPLGRSRYIAVVTLLLLLTIVPSASATIDGIHGTVFNFTAGAANISCADGSSPLVWGFANQGTPVQYPGPTLLLNEGDTVTITLTNTLSEPISMVFPGMGQVIAAEVTPPTQAGLLTVEALPGGTVSYTFTASQPGTYQYYSGTDMDTQVEMGLFGAIIVYPSTEPFNDGKHAYNHEDSRFDREFLFLLSEMDPEFHKNIALGRSIDTTSFFPVMWFINGRNAPDTMDMAGDMAPWFPHQPYNCMVRMNPSDRLLLRFIGAGRDAHPFHTHGNHMVIIAKNGKLLSSAPGSGADLATLAFTNPVGPGETYDATFTWTGEGLGWDIYGHAPGDPMEPNEDPNDHGKPIPVSIPHTDDLTIGDFYSGSPFLGTKGQLPPGVGPLNQFGGFFYMWHSHNEKEMTNYDVFPGGMMTMMAVEAPWVVIPE